ncbi:Predicted protein [Taphrina deformans PYCC 5710]|uniref:1-alkyl-2-acetylglycerophosphocholine esterase n=1 Tax=Taphrina deformans (strain PYCC 5710 / ATCC 11124 / CBS 356.35 / IMI 108563 / JCM 9778 / NBRC 8474) TaxID=1097556 RepID=R4X7C3_TAPDE|nr:Predicted protein [Taphrina deformans PYCC 5710]|eukprot:CCG80978.1 Predicted protein [Taphrina deformans PYCC 5710]
MIRKMMGHVPIPQGNTDSNTSNNQPRYKRVPKSRRPGPWRDYIIKSLPASSGPYDVGSIDLEIAVEREDFGIVRDGKPAVLLETVLWTIFYPIALGTGKGRAPDGKKQWSRQLWLSKSRSKMARGYGDFSGVNKAFCQIFFNGTVGLTKLPVWRNAPLAQHFPAEGNVHEDGHEIRDKSAENPYDRPPIFPLILFSHGLGGTRTTYSAVCGEYASYGWICCAVEHRDGSGPRTFVNYGDGRPPRVVDYVNPADGKNDTANDVPTDHELRNAQIRMRKREIDLVHDFMTEIYDGKGEQVAARNLRAKNRKDVENVIGGSSRGTKGVDWSAWKGRFQIDKVTMCGHSFGGATTMSVLRTPEMLKYIKYGILMDIWGQAMPTHPIDGELDVVQVPVLLMGSESFLYWEENLKLMFDLARDISKSGQRIWMFTIRGSFHLSFSDFGVLWPHLFKIMFNTRIHPQRAIDIIVNASLEFFKQVMPDSVARWNRGTDEQLLLTPINDKWRNIEGKRNDWRKKMGTHADDKHEIWMHLTPDSGFAGIEGHTSGGTDATAHAHNVSTASENANSGRNKSHARRHHPEKCEKKNPP